VEDLVQLTIAFWKWNDIVGLFVSPGIIRSHDDKMVRVARSLSEDQLLGGCIHLKLIGGRHRNCRRRCAGRGSGVNRRWPSRG
jgi:predicted DNA-binding helix-hairpin-helix protein